jgi:hypothetical protein
MRMMMMMMVMVVMITWHASTSHGANDDGRPPLPPLCRSATTAGLNALDRKLWRKDR